MKKQKKVVVIGAGASGLMAAICARRNENDVILLESMDKAGKKILMTGNGKCNLTNMHMSLSCYQNLNKEIIKEVFQIFDEKDTCRFFEDLGMKLLEKNGYVYPNSEQASSVAQLLTEECERLGVKIVYRSKVTAIQKAKTGKGYIVCCEQGSYQADHIILSTGSKAYSKTGSDGSGYTLLRQLHCKIYPPLPALTALRCEEKFCKTFAGVRVNGKITLFVEKEKIKSDTGQLQLTDYGVSGIPAFQVSRYASVALKDQKQVVAVLDFMPQISFAELYEFFEKKIIRYPQKTMFQQLTGVFNQKLAQVLLEQCHLSKDLKSCEIGTRRLKQFINKIKNFSLKVTSTNGFENSQICCGGLDPEELDYHTLELKRQRGIYVTGEVIDVDGICGGYNLQWAWSSGYVAGQLGNIV